MPGGDLPMAAWRALSLLEHIVRSGNSTFILGFRISGFWDRDRLMQQVISVCLDAASLALSLPGAVSSAIARTYMYQCCNSHLMAWTSTPKLGVGLGRFRQLT